MMLIKNKFFNLVILAWMVLGNNFKNKNNETNINPRCINYREVCDLKNGITCCDENLICKLAISSDFFLCAREAKLGEYCELDEDCGTVWHAECSVDNKCICMPNHIQKKNRNCAPLLGEYCVLRDQCGPENSVCTNNKCQCKDGYFLNSQHECLPITIGRKCEKDGDCSGLKFAKCSTDKICTCATNSVSVNPALCFPLLNVFCRNNEDCMVDNSICMDNKCKCKFKHIDSYNKCLPMYLGMPCEDDLDCRMFMNNTMCSQNKRCICDYNYFQTIDEICKHIRERSCLNDKLCDDDNSICVDKKCQCKPQYFDEESKCLPMDIVMFRSCNADFDCNRVQNAVCSDSKKCICKDGYFDADERECRSKLGEICQTDKQCYIKNSTCIDNRCQCEHDYLNVDDKQCILMDSLKRPCYNNDPNCLLIATAECPENKQCTCRDYRLKINSTECTALPSGYCINNNQCGSTSSVCVKHQCICKFEYVSHFKIDCPTPYLGMSCQYDSYCQNFIKNTVCLRNICECDDKYSINNNLCLPKLHAPCSGIERCAPANSVCIDNKCQCKTDYVQEGSECVISNARLKNPKDCSIQKNYSGANLNTSLTQLKYCCDDQDCWSLKNSECSLTNACVCKKNYFASEKNYCYPVLNGFCIKDEQCGLNFHCVNSKCQCKPNFSSISANLCVPTGQLYSCNDNLDCSDPWHSKCSENKKCVCNLNNIAVSNSTCLPLLDGYCWRDDQCKAINSICDDFRCRCRPNFVAIADNLCLLKN